MLVTGRLDEDTAARPSAWSRPPTPRRRAARAVSLYQPTARFAGAPEAIAVRSRQQQELLGKLYGRLAQRTGQPAGEIAEDMRRGRRLDAREMLDYGLIDEIFHLR